MNALAVLLTVVFLAAPWHLTAAEPLLIPDRDTYNPGEPITITFQDAPGNPRDWIAVTPEGVPFEEFFEWLYLDGTQVGELSLTEGQIRFAKGPTEIGTYEIRLFTNDTYNLVARTSIVVDDTPRLTLSKLSYHSDETISIQFRYGLKDEKNWIGLYLRNAPSSEPILRSYVDGTQSGTTAVEEGKVVFVRGLPSPGNYEVRFFPKDSFNVLLKVPFTVEESGPELRTTSGDGNVRLAWEALTAPIPAVRYQVRAATNSAGPFVLLAEVDGLGYLHAGLENGQEFCYRVRAVFATGELGADSRIQCTAPYQLPPSAHIAYQVWENTPGNLNFSGPIGMEFEVLNPILVSHLGAFDDGADGFKATVTVRLYDAVSRTQTASLEFSPQAPGVLRGGSRFKALAPPLLLPAGFRGTIVAEGYGPEEQAGSVGVGSLGVTGDSGAASIFFLGSGRTGPTPGDYPINVGQPGTPIAYAAGTFQFELTAASNPGKPTLIAVPGDAAVTLTWGAINQPLQATKYQILRGESEATLTFLTEAAGLSFEDSGLQNGRQYFYAIRAVAAGGEIGVASEPVQITPSLPSSGVAYLVAAGTVGTQMNFGGNLGADFDVHRPVLVTRLGVFDDLSDGLQRQLTARLYDRATELELAQVIFTSEDPGELVGGSRFKDLTTPLFLPIGFQGTIAASGYGPNERNGNTFGLPSTGWTVQTGGSLGFTGSSRSGINPDGFPRTVESGPMNRYAAGTFFFEPVALGARLQIAISDGKASVRWTNQGILETSPSLGGPWFPIPGSVSGTLVPLDQSVQYFRLRQ